MLLWLVPTVAYTLVGFVVCRALTGHFAWSWATQKAERERAKFPGLSDFPVAGTETPSGEQWFGAFCSAFPIAAIWPATLAFTHVPLKIGAEREAERRQMNARIEKLEREAGL